MPTNVICFGDSITAANGFAEGDRWPTVLQAKLNALQPDAYKVYNKGIGGNTACQGSDRWMNDVAPLLPGILLLEFGFNDASVIDWTTLPRVSIPQFKLKMQEFHRVALAKGGRPIFIVNQSIGIWTERQGNGQPYHENYAPYEAAIRELVADLEAESIDLPAMMEERQIELRSFLAADKIHLSPQGNHDYADMIFAGLQALGAVSQEGATG